jgi:hypothetical protein
MTIPPWKNSFSRYFSIRDSANRQTLSGIQDHKQHSADLASRMPPKTSGGQQLSRFSVGPSCSVHTPGVESSCTGAVAFSRSLVQGILIPPFIPPAEKPSDLLTLPSVSPTTPN